MGWMGTMDRMDAMDTMGTRDATDAGDAIDAIDKVKWRRPEAARFGLMDGRRPEIRLAAGWQGGVTKPYPWRCRESKPTKPDRMPSGPNSGGSVRPDRG